MILRPTFHQHLIESRLRHPPLTITAYELKRFTFAVTHPIFAKKANDKGCEMAQFAPPFRLVECQYREGAASNRSPFLRSKNLTRSTATQGVHTTRTSPNLLATTPFRFRRKGTRERSDSWGMPGVSISALNATSSRQTYGNI